MKKNILSIFVSVTVLTACLPPHQPIKKTMPYKIVEPLQQIKIEDKQLIFNVMSTGCTQTDDFIVNSQTIDQQCQLTIYRIKPDLCKRAALPMQIKIDWDKNAHCNDNSVQLINPPLNQNIKTF